MQRDPKVLKAVLDVAVQPVGIGHKLVDALDFEAFQGASTRHDETDVARPQDHDAVSGAQVLDVDVTLGEARGVYTSRTAARDFDLEAGALATAHGEHHRAAGEAGHTVFAHDGDAVCRVFSSAFVDAERHGPEHDIDAGLAHAVDETLGVFGAGELFFEMGEAEAGVDALAQDAAKMLVALDDYGRRAGFVRCEGSSHARGAAADDDDVVIVCFNLSHASSPPRRWRPCGRPGS